MIPAPEGTGPPPSPGPPPRLPLNGLSWRGGGPTLNHRISPHSRFNNIHRRAFEQYRQSSWLKVYLRVFSRVSAIQQPVSLCVRPFRAVCISPCCNFFRIRTCKNLSKQTALTLFSIIAYEKHRGERVLLLTRFPLRKSGLGPARRRIHLANRPRQSKGLTLVVACADG
jgi:hypothetical protein